MKDTLSKPNEQLFSKQVVIQLLILKTIVTSIFTYFLFHSNQNHSMQQEALWAANIQMIILLETVYSWTQQHVTLRNYNRSTHRRRKRGGGAGGPGPPPNNLRGEGGNIPFGPPIIHPHFPSISM